MFVSPETSPSTWSESRYGASLPRSPHWNKTMPTSSNWSGESRKSKRARLTLQVSPQRHKSESMSRPLFSVLSGVVRTGRRGTCMSRTMSWGLILGVMALLVLALIGVARMPVAIPAIAPPSHGVSTAARSTLATLGIVVVAVIGLAHAFAADRFADRRARLSSNGLLWMVVAAVVVGLIALFSAGF